MMDMRSYFDRAAVHYVDAVEPVFAPLAERLVNLADLRPDERVIDLGTGSGLIARRAARFGRSVVAVDFSRRMLDAAARQQTGNLIQGDMHRLPFCTGSFEVALAAFAYNSTDPSLSLPETRRLLVPGGRLVLFEWGRPDLLSDLVSETIEGYAVVEPSPMLAALRDQIEISFPWDELEDVSDLCAIIRQAGFVEVRSESLPCVIRLPSVEAFIRYKLAWPIAQAELAAMPEETRQLCLEELREKLAAHAKRGGRLIWELEVVCVRAYATSRYDV